MAHSATVQADMEIETTIENAPLELQSLRKPPTTKVRLIIEEAKPEKNTKQPSKWSKIVERNRKDPINLGDYTEDDRRYRREFRENFEFNHDK